MILADAEEANILTIDYILLLNQLHEHDVFHNIANNLLDMVHETIDASKFEISLLVEIADLAQLVLDFSSHSPLHLLELAALHIHGLIKVVDSLLSLQSELGHFHSNLGNLLTQILSYNSDLIVVIFLT